MFTVDPAMDLAVDDARTADSCAQGRHHQRIGLPTSAEMILADGGGIGIVFQVNRDFEGLPERCNNVCVLPAWQGVRIVNRAAQRIHRTGAANANTTEELLSPFRF